MLTGAPQFPPGHDPTTPRWRRRIVELMTPASASLLKARAVVAAAVLIAGCGFLTERRLAGRWETVETPKRTLELLDDHTYTQRLSGKTLAFVSDLLGPEKGTWAVEGEVLVLSRTDDKGVERTVRLPIHHLSGDAVVLGDERWVRKAQD